MNSIVLNSVKIRFEWHKLFFVAHNYEENELEFANKV